MARRDWGRAHLERKPRKVSGSASLPARRTWSRCRSDGLQATSLRSLRIGARRSCWSPETEQDAADERYGCPRETGCLTQPLTPREADCRVDVQPPQAGQMLSAVPALRSRSGSRRMGEDLHRPRPPEAQADRTLRRPSPSSSRASPRYPRVAVHYSVELLFVGASNGA